MNKLFAFILSLALLLILLPGGAAMTAAQEPPPPLPNLKLPIPWDQTWKISCGYSTDPSCGHPNNQWNHYALDFINAAGGPGTCDQPIFAAHSGLVVISSEPDPLAGNWVQIAADGDFTHYVTYYAHLDSIKEGIDGKFVNQGEEIGRAGRTGSLPTGCHLHFALWYDQNCVMPEPMSGITGFHTGQEFPPDTEPPTGGFTAPANGYITEGDSVAVRGWADDNRGVKRVNVWAYYDGSWAHPIINETAPPYEATWDVSNIAPQDIILSFDVTDQVGLLTNQQITIHHRAAGWNLAEGWSLVSTFPGQSGTAASLVDSLCSTCGVNEVTVCQWKSRWECYIYEDGQVYGFDFDIQVGRGYFIRSTKYCSWLYTGSSGSYPTSIAIQAGFNIIGSLPRNAYTAQSMMDEINAQGGEVTSVSRYKFGEWKAREYREGYTFGPDFPIEPGMGYVVRATKNSTWNPTHTQAVTAQPRPVQAQSISGSPFPTSNVRLSNSIDHRKTNLTNNQVTVSWVSPVSEPGYIRYGTTPDDLKYLAFDRRGSAYSGYTHYMDIEGLIPATTYHYEIVCPRGIYRNNGVPFSFTTGPTISDSSKQVAEGHVRTFSGIGPAVGSIVYLTLVDGDSTGSSGQSTELSALVTDNGTWTIELNNARTTSLSAHFDFSTSGDSVQLYVQGGPWSTASRTLDTGAISPMSETLILPGHFDLYLPLVLKSFAPPSINATLTYHSYDATTGWVTFQVVNNASGATLESARAQIVNRSTSANYYGPATSDTPFRSSPTSDVLVDSVSPGTTAYMRYKLTGNPTSVPCRATITLYSGEGSTGASSTKTVDFDLPAAINATVTYHSYDAATGWVTFQIVNNAGGATLECVRGEIKNRNTNAVYYGPAYSNSPFRTSPTQTSVGESSMTAGQTRYLRFKLTNNPTGVPCRATITLYTGNDMTGASSVKTIDFDLP